MLHLFWRYCAAYPNDNPRNPSWRPNGWPCVVRSRPRKGRLRHLTKVRCTRSPFSGFSLRFPRGAGYTFGSGVVYKFLDQNNMSHILRAHQLCMEGYASLFDKHLSTVWSAPNYCYRCGNSASILEVGPGSSMYFNVFDAAPENERDGPTQQAAQNAGGKVCLLIPSANRSCFITFAASRIFLMIN